MFICNGCVDSHSGVFCLWDQRELLMRMVCIRNGDLITHHFSPWYSIFTPVGVVSCRSVCALCQVSRRLSSFSTGDPVCHSGWAAWCSDSFY